MGDRGSIYFVEESGEDGLYFYTHWLGRSLPETLRAALLRGKGRWGDSPYLARIIFSEMIQGNVLGETGFGISMGLIGGEHPILVVNSQARRVGACAEGKEKEVASDPDMGCSFEEYIRHAGD